MSSTILLLTIWTPRKSPSKHESWHMYEWVTSHVWMTCGTHSSDSVMLVFEDLSVFEEWGESPLTHINGPWRTNEWFTYRWFYHLFFGAVFDVCRGLRNEADYTYEGVTTHVCMSHVPRMKAHTWSHVPTLLYLCNDSWVTWNVTWVMVSLYISHVTRE